MADKQFSKETFDKLFAELKDLTDNKRREVAGKLKIARSKGDLCENAEYVEAKKEQAAIEARIAEIDKIINDMLADTESENVCKN